MAAQSEEDPRAQYNRGTEYWYGSGVPQDYVEAAKWFRKAAVRGFAEGYDLADLSRVKDLLKYPELRFLDRFDIVVPTALGAGVFLLALGEDDFTGRPFAACAAPRCRR